MNDIQMIQTQIDILADQLDRNSAHCVSNRRERDEIRAAAIHLIQQRDGMRRRRPVRNR